MRNTLKTACALVGALSVTGAALAVAPGPIDGLAIPSTFGGANELAAQTNNTGFGDQSLGTGAFTPGSELDGLYLAKDVDFLYVGLSGNLEQNGHAFVVFIDLDDPFFPGQTELRAEGVGGPPFALQTASREIIINTNGPGDASDDTWEYGTNGTTLPCEADFAIAVDVFGGTMSISEYKLFDPNLGSVGTNDPTPDNEGDLDQDLYATRTFIGQTAVNDDNDVLENLQAGNDYGPGGFNNTNTTGVTDVDASNANAATTGMELAIPLSNFQGVDNINIMVALVDGGGLTGTFTPQVLPSITDADVCTSAFSLREDLSTTLSCLPISVSALPTFTGAADGIISAVEYGAAITASQSCPTTYGDQLFDENATTISNGTELNVLYATNDDDNLYLGITGNLERGGNTLHVFIDTDPDGADLGTNGRELDNLGVPFGIDTSFVPFQALQGLTGDSLPEDINSNAVNFNWAFGINLDGGNDSMYVDRWNLVTKDAANSYAGSSQRNSGDGTLVGGNFANNIQIAYNDGNEAGVEGDCFDGGSCLFQTTNGTGTPAQVDALAHSALRGFEFSIPWADLDVDTSSLPSHIHIWVYATGSGPDAFGSNQSLPSMRPRSDNATDGLGSPIKHMIENLGTGPLDYSDGSGPPQRQADSYAARYEVVAGVLCADTDVNCSGQTNAGDIGIVAGGGNFLASPPPCDRADVNKSGQANAGDIGLIAGGGNFLSETGPCICVTSTPGVAGCPTP